MGLLSRKIIWNKLNETPRGCGRAWILKGGGVKMNARKWILLMLGGLLAGSLTAAPPAFANNVAVSNVELKSPTASTVVVEFDLSQDNPFGDLTDANSAAFSDY